MNHDFLLSSIARHVQLSKEEEQKLVALLSEKKLKRKEFLFRSGDDARYEFFVTKGCLRTYYLDNKGVEHTTYLPTEGYWVSDIYGRTFEAPAICSNIALEDCELLQISNADLERALKEIPALERYFRIAYQKALATHHFRTLQVLSLSGMERYLYFRANFPELDQRVPQKYIASYLGLTPEFFNTLRSKAIRSLK